MRDWFGRDPAFSYVARELSKVERLIHLYRRHPDQFAVAAKVLFGL